VKKFLALLLVQFAWETGISQSLSFKFGTPFKPGDLKVVWATGSNTLPQSVWVYRISPNHFSEQIISNVTRLSSFTHTDLKKRDTNSIIFETEDHSRRLTFDFHTGSIEYETPSIYYPTNLPQAVPTEVELRKLIPVILPEFGIQLSEIDKNDGGEPNVAVFDSLLIFNVKGNMVTNVPFRGLRFTRAINGAKFVGARTGGHGEIRFGDHGKVTGVSISWRNLQRHKQYSTVSPATLIDWIHQGKARQNMIAANLEPIDWKTVKDVVITRARVCYYAGGPFEPSDWLVPFAALWTQVHSEGQGWEVEIDCPIYDPKKPMPERGK
jgi:hypothetical protein